MSKRKQCPRCKVWFTCEESTKCWCNNYPSILTKAPPEYKDCMCKKCVEHYVAMAECIQLY